MKVQIVCWSDRQAPKQDDARVAQGGRKASTGT
jgi:hypothetical protein